MSEITEQQFWAGISILLNNYHAINRKIFACVINKVEKVISGITGLTSIDWINIKDDTNKEELEKTLMLEHLNDITKFSRDYEGFIVYFKLLSKKSGQNIEAIGILDFTNTLYQLKFLQTNLDDFEVKLVNNNLEATVLSQRLDIEVSTRFLEYILKPKLLKWCQNANKLVVLDEESNKTSLRLIDLEKYNKLYKELKQKYSERALMLWNEAKESTDPLKFIYEDLAIAAYLICLWQSDLLLSPNQHQPLAFADLGCGNGLLVYILIEEGYQGYGYDVRARKLWSLYPSNVASRLFEHTINPSAFKVPSDVNWLIGNHSDELSPWLPLLTATSTYNMNYFLLPCCAYEFSGNKFQRRNSSVSAYKDFCDYTKQISNKCGFVTLTDRLKIPSTKRQALIGVQRIYSKENHSSKLIEIKEYLSQEQKLHPITNKTAADSDGHNHLNEHNNAYDSTVIKLREKHETVKNCTQIDKEVIDKLVKKIFLLLLNTTGKTNNDSNNTQAADKDDQNDKLQVNKKDAADVAGKTIAVCAVVQHANWQQGGFLTIGNIAKQLDRSDLINIKSECGGLKTLLRNKHEIFEFSAGFIKIRKPQIWPLNLSKPQTIKKRLCFFKQHHPQGCPLTDEECTFIH